MIIRNEDIREVMMDVPEGHKHLRTRILLADNSELILLEAAIANIVRAYITLKTHPQKTAVLMRGIHLEEKKEGFADWQLIEE